MTLQDSEPGDGVLVISVWHETDAQDGFRARLVFGSGIEANPVSTVACTPEDVVAAVADWLGAITP
jgi:hypothetical protein